MEAEDDLLYISSRWSPTSRDLQEVVLCLLPTLVILHVADMLFNRATNASNLLPSSLSLTQHSRSRPAVTVRFLGGPQKKLMRYSPCIQACEPQGSESQPRIPLPWICHLCLFERLVMLTTLRFPRSYQILLTFLHHQYPSLHRSCVCGCPQGNPRTSSTDTVVGLLPHFLS